MDIRQVVLDTALLVVSTVATLSAFGGKTCEEGNEALSRRIRTRGWAFLVCLALALGLGVTKELLAKRQADMDAANAKKIKDAAEASIQELHDQLRDSQSNLRVANANLEQVRQRLDDSQTSLMDVRTTLGSAREDLSKEGSASLLTAFANSKLAVSDVRLFLPFTSRARRSTNPQAALLPPFSDPACRDLMEVRLYASLTGSHVAAFPIEAGDASEARRVPDQEVQLAQKLTTVGDAYFDTEEADHLIHQRTRNGYIYLAEIHPKDNLLSAAAYVAEISDIESSPIQIIVSWPKGFDSRKALEEYDRQHPNVLPPLSGFRETSFGSSTRWTSDSDGHYPRNCSKEVKHYLAAAVEDALVVMYLDNRQAFAFPLKAKPPKEYYADGIRSHGGIVQLNFKPESAPLPMMFGDGYSFDNLVDWSKTDSQPQKR